MPALLTMLLLSLALPGQTEKVDYSPRPEEKQLPYAMHSEMEKLPTITVGPQDADLIGKDNRALQAAVDYVANLGGGTVEILAGEYLMHDSLHLRPNVTIKGQGEKTILRKARAVISPLALDGDYGEEQITVENPEGFRVGYGVAIWDKNSGGFHTTVARITGQRGNTFSIDTPLNADCMVHQEAKAATVFPVISGYHTTNVRLEGITIEGNKEENEYLNGCRERGFSSIVVLARSSGTALYAITMAMASVFSNRMTCR